MTSPVLANLQAAVQKANGAMESAVVLINGIADRIQNAVNAAIANGASETDLASVQAEVDRLNTDAQNLADAVAANP